MIVEYPRIYFLCKTNKKSTKAEYIVIPNLKRKIVDIYKLDKYLENYRECNNLGYMRSVSKLSDCIKEYPHYDLYDTQGSLVKLEDL